MTVEASVTPMTATRQDGASASGIITRDYVVRLIADRAKGFTAGDVRYAIDRMVEFLRQAHANNGIALIPKTGMSEIVVRFIEGRKQQLKAMWPTVQQFLLQAVPGGTALDVRRIGGTAYRLSICA